MWSTGPGPSNLRRDVEAVALGVSPVGGAVGEVQAGPATGVQPVAGEVKRRALAAVQAERALVEVGGALDVVAEHEHVLKLGDGHLRLDYGLA